MRKVNNTLWTTLWEYPDIPEGALFLLPRFYNTCREIHRYRLMVSE